MIDDGVTRPLQLSWIVDTSLLEFIRLAGAGVQTMTTASAVRWVHCDPGAVAALKLGCRAVRALQRYTTSTDKGTALFRYLDVEVF